MLTKKDYVAIAAILAKEIETKGHPRAVTTLRTVAVALAEYFRKDNPRFDETRFLNATKVFAVTDTKKGVSQ